MLGSVESEATKETFGQLLDASGESHSLLKDVLVCLVKLIKLEVSLCKGFIIEEFDALLKSLCFVLFLFCNFI